MRYTCTAELQLEVQCDAKEGGSQCLCSTMLAASINPYAPVIFAPDVEGSDACDYARDACIQHIEDPLAGDCAIDREDGVGACEATISCERRFADGGSMTAFRSRRCFEDVFHMECDCNNFGGEVLGPFDPDYCVDSLTECAADPESW